MSEQASDHCLYPELTWQALIFGALLGVIMTSIFVYVGVKLGFGLGGSTVAVNLGFVVLRALGTVELNLNSAWSTLVGG